MIPSADQHSCEPQETSQRHPPATGDPQPGFDDRSVDHRSKDDLYQLAKRLKIEGRSRMSREQLIKAIERRR